MSNGDQRAQAFAEQLQEWAELDIVSTAYLRGGGRVSSDCWRYSADGLLSFEGQGGTVHLLDPGLIAAAVCGTPDEADPGFVPA